MSFIQELLQEINEKLDSLGRQVSESNRRDMSVASAATYADLSETSIKRLCQSGKLKALRAVKGKILSVPWEIEGQLSYVRVITCRQRPGKNNFITNMQLPPTPEVDTVILDPKQGGLKQ